jgi:hypothetical protein
MNTATMIADDRQGPEALRIPEPGETTNAQKTDAELPDTTAEINETRQANDNRHNGKGNQLPWCPDGFYWVVDRHGEPFKLAPTRDFVKLVAKEAVERFLKASQLHGKSEELKALIESGASELREYLFTRKAINPMSFARKMKGEADDAAYQIVQAAKYKLDGMSRIRNNLSKGYKPEDDTVKKLKHYADNSMYEGYALHMIVQMACNDTDFVPTFDYEAAAWRVCNFSASKLTESLLGKARNEKDAERLDEQAAKIEAERYFD